MIAHDVRTADGWRLGLLECPPGGAARGTVLIVHGLGATPFNYDLPGVFSPARWLAARGWRVFLGGLRGRRPGEERPGGGWRFSDYVERDAPALEAAVRSLCGGPFHWIGHSLGGIVGLIHAFGGERELVSLTTLGSALNYTVGGSFLPRLAPLRGRLGLIRRVPSRLYHRLLSPFWASGLLPCLIYRRENLGFRAAMSFHWNGQTDLSVAELEEVAERALDAAPRPFPPLTRPLLSVAGTHDRVCPPDTVRWTYERLTAPRKEWLLVDGVGHFDLAVSQAARERTWPAVEAFMENAILSRK